MSKGVRFCSSPCPPADFANVMVTLNRYPFVVSAGEISYRNGRVEFGIDLFSLALPGDGACAEAMVLRDVELAIALHDVPANVRDLSRGLGSA